MTKQESKTMPAWTHPVRIPEGVAITHAEPPFAFAGEMSTWRLPFVLSRDVPSGAALELQIWGGRNNKGAFQGAQSDSPSADGFIAAEADGGNRLAVRADGGGTLSLAVPDGGLRKGQTLAVVLGDRTGGGGGIRACRERLLNKFFVLYSRPGQAADRKLPEWAGGKVWAGEALDHIVAACTMHVLGGSLRRIRAYAPAATRPGTPFGVLVRPEDELGNLSHETPEAIEIFLGDRRLDATVERIPESSCLRATVSLDAEGVHRLTVLDAASGLKAATNPTRCSKTAREVCWGMIHGHTEMSDGTGCIEQYFHQLRNEVLLDFAAPGDHDHLWETSDDMWRQTCAAVKRWHSPHEFVTLLGYEWAKWRKNGDGDRNVYYFEDDRPMYRSDDGQYPSPPDLFAALRKGGEKAIVIPHHTGHGGNFCDWKDHSPEHERLVEIFQIRGSYECSAEDGNPAPELPCHSAPYPAGYVRNALALGWRVGFTAGGDDHAGQWGTDCCMFGPEWNRYKQGLMSVEAGGKTRKHIFQAMYDRRVVATTGARMLLTYGISGNAMGSELSVKDAPDLAPCRALAIEFHGTAPLKRIDIVRNNKVVHSIGGAATMDIEAKWEDRQLIEQTWLPASRFCGHPFTFYYVRAVQEDGEAAWASPIWIDP